MVLRAFPASQNSDYSEVSIPVSASVGELKLELDYTSRPFVCFDRRYRRRRDKK
jgi:hypothetical protein